MEVCLQIPLSTFSKCTVFGTYSQYLPCVYIYSVTAAATGWTLVYCFSSGEGNKRFDIVSCWCILL